MSVYVAGAGWVTPLGSGISEVWERLLQGEQATPEKVSDPVGGDCYPAFRVPLATIKNLPPHPRLRRASAISRFAAAAGLAAVKDAGLTADAETTRRMALVFAIANGGVIYTKRFYNDIVTTGADAASPLLFPETVFNAAASHLAAIIGVAGTTYTLVGDGAIGLLAMKMAEDLMANEEIDYCLVVGAEEADWLLCDAYRKWRLVRSGPPIEPFRKPAKGTILSEGAGAVLLARNGPVRLDLTDAGAHYSRRRDLPAVLKEILGRVATDDTDVVLASANGTFIDAAEAEAVSQILPSAPIYTAKMALGESVGASALWQVVLAAQVLKTQALPPVQLNAHREKGPQSAQQPKFRRAIVTACGVNQQVAVSRLSI